MLRMSGKLKTNKELAIELGHKQKKKGTEEDRAEWRRRQTLCTLRPRAQKAIETLTESLEEIRKVSKHPERDYARIFKDDTCYLAMVTVCCSARTQGLKWDLTRGYLQNALISAGLGYYSKRKLSDENVRAEAIEKLIEARGFSFYGSSVTPQKAQQEMPTDVLLEEANMALAESFEVQAVWEYAKKVNGEGLNTQT